MTKKILFFLEGPRVPSSRFRVLQFQDKLSEQGISFHNAFTWPSKYSLYPRNCRKSALRYVFALASLVLIVGQRIFQIIRHARSSQVIFLQRDLLFRVPIPFLEALLFLYTWDLRIRQRVRIVFDVDDAIFLSKSGHRTALMDWKFGFICRRCDVIIAGNKYLAAYFAQFALVEVIPTVVDTVRTFAPQVLESKSDSIVVLGWTGLSANLPELESLLPVFSQLAKKHRIRLRIIAESGAVNPFSGQSFESELFAWSPEDEAALLQHVDIGLMPLAMSDWSRGKCGFKLIQYLALGIPAVASRVGVNQEILEAVDAGRLASSAEEWISALEFLIANKAERQALGMRGREYIQNYFCQAAWTERWHIAVLKMNEDLK